jgi:hypothetical protein
MSQFDTELFVLISWTKLCMQSLECAVTSVLECLHGHVHVCGTIQLFNASNHS